jgi:protein-tyrosine phosphatase
MYTKVYWIYQYPNGSKLGIMPRPRGGEWLENEILTLKKQSVGVVVSLLEMDEIDELDLGREMQICSNAGIEYINIPIADRSIPSKNSNIEKLLIGINHKLENESSVVIHCRMGIGRSSIIAGCLLQTVGFKTSQIIDLISKIRGMKVPDTEEQLNWLKKRE